MKRPEGVPDVLTFFPPGAAKLAFDHDLCLEKSKTTTSLVRTMISKKRIPAVSVYIVSSNKSQEEVIQNIFEGVPCRLVKLGRKDFYETLPYQTIGVDRLAACKGASSLPALIIDGGTAMTYTSVDQEGKIEGGGISPGLNARFRALGDYCDALPTITPDEVKKAVIAEKDASDSSSLPFLSTNTRQAMTGSILREVAVALASIVDQWKRHHGLDKEEEGKKSNHRTPQVYLTGSDASVFQVLLKNPSYCLSKSNGSVFSRIEHEENLLHLGIRNLIQEKSPSDESRRLKEGSFELASTKRLYLVGQRIVRDFGPVHGFFAGVVVKVVMFGKIDIDSDTYLIAYDDGDAEEVDVVQLYGT